MLRSINPKRPRVHGSDHINAGEDPVPGALIFIDSNETDSAETVSSIAETTKNTISLPVNSFAKIYIEFAAVHRYEVDVAAKMNATYRIKLDGVLQKTFAAKILANSLTGVDTGQKEPINGSVIIAGGQTSVASVTITGQIDVNNAGAGFLTKFVRLWGINKNIRP